jgi:hypothetical protein
MSSPSCPSCNSENIVTLWVDHRFPYDTSIDPILLKCTVPLRVCRQCDVEYLDYAGEDIMDEVVRVHLLPPVIVNNAWIAAGESAAQLHKAFNSAQILSLMRSHKVQIDEMPEWCVQWKWDYPCLFQSSVVEGIG